VLTYRSIFKGDFEKGFQLFSRSENELQKIVQVSPDGFLVLSFAGLHYINKYRKQATGLMKNLIVPINTPYQLFKDNSSRIYISDGADGLNIFKWQQGQIDSVAAVTGVGYITEMAESGNREVLWLASSKGLLKFLPDKNFAVEYIRDADGLLDQTINSVFISRSGSVWVSSNNGLYKYDPATNRAKRYSESDGLQSAQFLPSSGCQLTGGKICFGGINGLNVFDPETVRDYSTAPVIHLTEIIINNKDTLKGQNINYLTEWTFPFSQNTIQIDFTGIEYGAPNEVVFSYFLKGYDIDTIYGGTNGTARYTRLPKGNYTLQIFAANSDGVWASQPKEFKIRVLPHWTDTWWFKSIVAVFILALLYAYYRFRVDQIKKQEEMRRKEAEFKQKEAEFRQKEAEYKQLVAETETAVLRLQMNPHFIFNSMNSINSYILQRDIDTASDYLGRFAKLMRMILKYAANKYISVSDEIELLELYLQTEAMRFEQRFTYHFEVDEMLDPDEVVLPTMILQPFVENAIWHGLSKKTSGGRVVISFQKQNGSLACSVEDNGIGRQAAEAQKDRSKGHESKALAITAQRLKLLEKEENSPAHIEMIDLTNDENQASGTKVVLILPFL
jgi:two-component sensor histidine kinase